MWGVSFYMIDNLKSPRYISFFLVLLVIATYFPGLNGGFHFDDYPNIVNNPRIHLQSLDPVDIWQATWSGQTGGIKRPLAVLSFALNTYFTGLSAPMMKITNLVIHLLNGICIIILSNLLLQFLFPNYKDRIKSNYLALLIGAIWLLHPLQLTSVLYVVQRMTSLATLFSLLAIISYCKIRIKQQNKNIHWLYFSLIFLFGLLSLLSKEIAVLIPIYLLCIEFFIFKFKCNTRNNKKFLYCFYLITVIIPGALGVVFLVLNPEWLAYNGRSFTLAERLMTETRVLVDYLKSIIAPNVINMGLLYGDTYTISKSFINPITTLFASLLILILLSIGFYLRNGFSYIGFGIYWFFSGHLLESTIIPLEIAFEHRNYLPSYGIIFALVCGLFIFFDNRNKNHILTVLVISFALVLTSVTFIRASHWENPIMLAIHDVQLHPDSFRANMTVGGYYQGLYYKSKSFKQKQQYYKEAVYYFRKAGKLDPDHVGPIIAESIISCMDSGNFSSSIVRLIKEKLENNDFSTESELGIIILTDRVIDGSCQIPQNSFFEIIDAAMKSKNLSNLSKSRLLYNLAAYHDKILNDSEKALLLAKAAVETSPNFTNYRIELINFYLKKGKFNEALEEVKTLESMDKFGFNAASIRKVYKIFDETNYTY